MYLGMFRSGVDSWNSNSRCELTIIKKTKICLVETTVNYRLYKSMTTYNIDYQESEKSSLGGESELN